MENNSHCSNHTAQRKKLLTPTVVENIVKDVLRKYKDVSYEISNSKTTFSIYIKLYYHGVRYTCRISDHYPHRSVRSLYISKKTKRSAVVRYITNTVKMLKVRSLNNALNINTHREQFNINDNRETNVERNNEYETIN